MYYVSTKGGGRGSAKCLLLITRGEGGGSKIPKTCLRNTWMFPYVAQTFQLLIKTAFTFFQLLSIIEVIEF